MVVRIHMQPSGKQLAELVQTVFDKEMFDLQQGIASWHIKTEQGKPLVSYPNADTLVDLFATIQDDRTTTRHFINLMQNRVEWDAEINSGKNTYFTVSSLCFYTLVKLGFTDKALESFVKRLNSSNSMLQLIQDILQEDTRYFDSLQLNSLFDGLKRVEVEVNQLAEKEKLLTDLINKRFDLLKKQIRTINVEINRDKVTFSEKITCLEFDKKYSDFLQEIDSFIYNDAPDIIDATLISRFRAFMEDFILELAENLAARCRDGLPVNKSGNKLRSAHDYLKTKLGLSRNDSLLISAFIDLLQAEGKQVFLSTKETLRLTRNLAIEICLLLVSRYEHVLAVIKK